MNRAAKKQRSRNELSDKKRNRQFWFHFQQERRKRRMSYADVNRAGGKRFAGASSIYRAAAEHSDPSLNMVATIAQAFEISRLRVLGWADFIETSPEELDNANLGLLELWELTRKLTPAEQETLKREVSGLVRESA